MAETEKDLNSVEPNLDETKELTRQRMDDLAKVLEEVCEASINSMRKQIANFLRDSGSRDSAETTEAEREKREKMVEKECGENGAGETR